MHINKKPDKLIGFTQSSYPAFISPSDEDYKTLLFVMLCKGRTNR